MLDVDLGYIMLHVHTGKVPAEIRTHVVIYMQAMSDTIACSRLGILYVSAINIKPGRKGYLTLLYPV
jgi:hypothetical protein